MSTYSSLKIELIGIGEQNNTWGTTNNANLGIAIEEAIVGIATATFTTDADLTLTLSDTTASQVARNLVLNIVSSVPLTVTRNVIVPILSGIYTFEKPYVVQNNTTGGQSIVVKTAAGTGVTVPNGSKAYVYADGTNVKALFDYMPSLALGAALSIANGGTGATNAANARTNLGLQSGAITAVGSIATQNSNAVSITGGSISNITPLEVTSGGTGASTAAGARANISAAQSGVNADITQLTALNTPFTIGQGGTGATTATTARIALGAAASGTNSDITSMSALTSISSSVTLASPTINSSANNTPTTKGENLFVSSLGTITGTTTINLASAQVFVATLTSAGVTFAFSNAPAQGEVVMFRLTNGGLGTVNWPANTKYPGGNSVLGLTSAGVDMLGVYYDITTTTYMVFTIGLDIK